jgi:hypothetical protein
MKQNAFLVWQADRTNVHKKWEYKELCRHVRHAARIDKEKWMDDVMRHTGDDMKRTRLGDFFKKLRKLMGKNTLETLLLLMRMVSNCPMAKTG